MQGVVYQVNIKLRSALHIGSGQDNKTDSDVVVDRNNKPYIPASALAGVLRSYVHKANPALEQALFGDMNLPSKVQLLITDARAHGVIDTYIVVRHRVALEKKVAIKGAKFDLEAVEPDEKTAFVFYIKLDDTLLTQNTPSEPDSEPTFAALQSMLEQALAALDEGRLSLGADTSRGYGRVALTVYKKCFNDVEAFLDFDIFDANSWSACKPQPLQTPPDSTLRLTLQLALQSPISIREYSTKPNAPDYTTMHLHTQADCPIIPGTSWAGAIRSRFSELAGEAETKKLFGYVDTKNNTSQKAEIVFGESRIEGGMDKDITRNSLDRFSMKTKDGALYTERTYVDGTTSLQMELPLDTSERAIAAIGICLMDLHRGFLAVGGLTAVGRGLFTVEHISVNGEKNSSLLSAVQSGDVEAFLNEFRALKGAGAQ